jgi:hypothetical protein
MTDFRAKLGANDENLNTGTGIIMRKLIYIIAIAHTLLLPV